MYGILDVESNTLLGFCVSANPESAEFCGDVEYSLDRYPVDSVWLVTTKAKAEHAMITDTEWYNAGYNTPRNPYLDRELKVVQVQLKVICEQT